MTKALEMSADSDRPGEFSLIERYFAPFADADAFGLRDDAALLTPTGNDMAITQDALAAGVHFLADDPPALIAKKALRVNLSDLAAKGAVPRAISLALGLGEAWTQEWVAGFAGGLREDCEYFGVTLTGGDTFRAPGGLVVAITAIGEITEGAYRSRLEARPGDLLFVTGNIGDAALGLKVHLDGDAMPELDAAHRAALQRAYMLPDPPVGFARAIARYASAAIDISDGFVGDLEKLARASGFDTSVDLAAIPFSQPGHAAHAIDGMLQTALIGGDDYQILFTAGEENLSAIEQAAASTGVQVTNLGKISAGQGKVTIRNQDGEPMRFSATSWDHFSGTADRSE